MFPPIHRRRFKDIALKTLKLLWDHKYIADGILAPEEKETLVQQIEEMRSILHLRNPAASAANAQTNAANTAHAPLTSAEMSAELQAREQLLQQRSANAMQTDRPTDQWRVYEECVEQL